MKRSLTRMGLPETCDTEVPWRRGQTGYYCNGGLEDEEDDGLMLYRFNFR
jgi:hypothetical protein